MRLLPNYPVFRPVVSSIFLSTVILSTALPSTTHAEIVLGIELSPITCRLHPNYASLRQCSEGLPLVVNFFDTSFRGQCSPQIKLNLSPLQEKVVTKVIPDPYMRQQLWQDYGVCSGQSSSNYFRSITNLYSTLRLPPELSNGSNLRVSHPQFLKQMAGNNAGMSIGSVRLYCQSKTSKPAILTHMAICYNNNGKFTQCNTPRPSNCPQIFFISR